MKRFIYAFGSCSKSQPAFTRIFWSPILVIATLIFLFGATDPANAQVTAPPAPASPAQQKNQQETKSEPEPETKPNPVPARPVFVDGQAQIVDAFNHTQKWIWHDLFVETEFDSDGDGKLDRMHVSVCRPEQTKTEGLKVPVIYNTSPYFCGTGDTDPKYMWNPKHEIGAEPPARIIPPEIEFRKKRPIISRSYTQMWVPRGFAVVHSCSPGTGLSQGCPTIGGDNESLAPKAVIDWLCGRAKGYTELDGNEEVVCDWCTGSVGMMGTSYEGTLPLAAATTGVVGLKAIISVAPNTSYYHYYRSNGLVRHPGGYRGEDADVLFDFVHSGDPEQREFCCGNVRDKVLADNQDRVSGDYNEFWAGRDYLHKLDGVKAATLIAHGLNDWNVMPNHSVRIFEALKKRGVTCQAFLHQGGHGGDPPMSQMNRWFTRYLYDIENGVEADPKAFIVREDAERTDPTGYANYPNPDAKVVTLNLSGDGNKNGLLDSSKANEQAPATLIDDVSITGAELAKAAESTHRLIYATSELKEPLHISGTARIRIKLSSSKPAANLSVWLVSLPYTDSEKINDNIITRGWADPQNRNSLTESKPLVPGEMVELEFDLEPDDQIIPVGAKIGLMIFSSDRDFTLWPAAGTELTIDPSATSLDLPLVGGVEAFQNATKK